MRTNTHGVCRKSRVFLVHGLLDQNVHFKHTQLLVNELNRFNKPFTVQTYPNEQHGIRNPYANDHFDVFLMTELLDAL